MGKIRVGVIGVGSIAEAGHFPNYAKHPDVELVAIADVDSQRAGLMAEKYGVPKVYSTAEDMLANENLDAVSVCTWNCSHVPLAELVVKLGVDVLVEKPLGLSYADTSRLAELVREKGQVGMVGMTHRYRNESQALKRIVDSGALGQIYYVKAQILRQRGTPTGWFTDISKSGGGPLMDIGVHVLDLAWWLAGQPEPTSVSGMMTKGLGNYQTQMLGRWKSSVSHNQDLAIFDVEDFASAFIRFKNGICLQLEVSWAINGPQDDELKVDIFGDKAGVSLSPLRMYSECAGVLTAADLNIDRNNPFEREISHFVSAVKDRTEPLSSISQGAEIVRILEAISLSSQRGEEVRL